MVSVTWICCFCPMRMYGVCDVTGAQVWHAWRKQVEELLVSVSLQLRLIVSSETDPAAEEETSS